MREEGCRSLSTLSVQGGPSWRFRAHIRRVALAARRKQGYLLVHRTWHQLSQEPRGTLGETRLPRAWGHRCPLGQEKGKLTSDEEALTGLEGDLKLVTTRKGWAPRGWGTGVPGRLEGSFGGAPGRSGEDQSLAAGDPCCLLGLRGH